MNITAGQLKKGTLVVINPQSDRSRKVMVTGAVDEILTRATSHPHGLLVRLQTGEIGRVKELVTDVEMRHETEESPLKVNKK